MKRFVTAGALASALMWPVLASHGQEVEGDVGATADVQVDVDTPRVDVQADGATEANANPQKADVRVDVDGRAAPQAGQEGAPATPPERPDAAVKVDNDTETRVDANRKDRRPQDQDRARDNGRDENQARPNRDASHDDDRQAKWRFRQHNGEWWYWHPSNYWMFHREGDWQRYSRSSYQPQRRQATGYRGYYDGPRYNEGQHIYYYDEHGNRYSRSYDPYRDGRNNGRYDDRYNDRYDGRNDGRYDNRYRGSEGERTGAAIGGAIGGREGANVGRIIGDAID